MTVHQLPRADACVFRVNAIHEDMTFTKTMTTAIRHEIEDLAMWLNLTLT